MTGSAASAALDDDPVFARQVLTKALGDVPIYVTPGEERGTWFYISIGSYDGILLDAVKRSAIATFDHAAAWNPDGKPIDTETAAALNQVARIYGVRPPARGDAVVCSDRGAREMAPLPPTPNAAGNRRSDAPRCALLLAEVRLPHQVGPQKLRGCGLQHDAPGLHDVTAVRDAERHPRVLLDQEDGRALAVDVLDD